MRPIYVVNNHGQFNHLIHRMLRDLGIEARMIPNTTPRTRSPPDAAGSILGGGPIDRAGRLRVLPRPGLPVLGICLGLHVIATAFRRHGQAGAARAVTGRSRSRSSSTTRSLQGYPGKISVWASHADEVSVAPPGFAVLARSSVCAHEAIALPDRHIYGLQWHPEVSHTIDGRSVYENFDRICREP